MINNILTFLSKKKKNVSLLTNRFIVYWVPCVVDIKDDLVSYGVVLSFADVGKFYPILVYL